MRGEMVKVLNVPVKELCDEGQRLWNAVDYHKQNSYDDYRRHLLECKKCQNGLERRERDLENIREDIEKWKRQ